VSPRDERPTDPDDAPETPAERRFVNALVVGFVVLIVAAGLWLGNALMEARRADECMSSGRRDCSPVPAPA
jgi:hypothetical protein